MEAASKRREPASAFVMLYNFTINTSLIKFYYQCIRFYLEVIVVKLKFIESPQHYGKILNIYIRNYDHFNDVQRVKSVDKIWRELKNLSCSVNIELI